MPSRFCTECGTELQAGQRFCPECGTAAQSPPERTTQTQKAPTTQKAPATQKTVTPAALGPRKPPMALLLTLGAVAIAVVLVATYWATARPPAIVGNFPAETSPDGVPFPDVPRISVEDAKATFDAGNAIVVDVRSQGQYTASHIPGAVLIPIDEFEERYSELPQNREILTYCT